MARTPRPRATETLTDPRWAAVVARDPAADGKFYYAVSTTGVYCRPSCGARTPRPENISFHSSTALAEQAGFRPCKRCQPDQPPLAERHAALVAQLCRLIEHAETPPSLEALAQLAKLSRFHLQRIFKSITGLTPKAYADAQRAARLRAGLATSASVTDAVLGAGYNASSRFYASADQVLGMTPTRFRAGGDDVEIRFAIARCSLGAILVAATRRGICAILMGDDANALAQDLQDRFPNARFIGGDADFEQWVAQVIGLVETPRLGLGLPLDLRGTAFQLRVWQALREIPPGTTLSYTELAKRIGAPSAARAVASACAANAVAVAVPCHRVVRSDGSLSGYRWGVERKRSLLEREAEE